LALHKRHIERSAPGLSTLYNQLHVHKSAQPEVIRSLPASTVEWLYQTLDPASVENPFKRTRKRWCVFVAFVLMLHQGLRRGEMLLLPAANWAGDMAAPSLTIDDAISSKYRTIAASSSIDR
jgi:hypothetical protein